MEEFLTSNASAIFAIFGAILGSLVTGFLSYLSKTKEAKLRITEKVLDRKLDAHESLINLVGLIRSMVLLGGEDDKNELKRCPLIMNSKENMNDFLDQFMSVQNNHDRWLSSEIKREISFFLDYFINLNECSRDATDEGLQAAGVLIRKDFIDISLRIENSAHVFFNKDLLKLKYKTDRDWHKHSKEKTLEGLNKTEFFKNKQKIMSMLNGRI
ncbi:hypothetical protein [Marinagarivorans cellulosilyticus]|uniref:Uncharacterized protein n=1 Tax=Marinagarivorans cellulosilyticus TaxID=2721545 RepID=A0AAN1WI91_9GAMM|nr:hypothetical protein [Marinagarivorans cellulosilyticus]BCD98108.1 hypothetical protein MARGE09_P2309 [Marinagarivorans cellulosilyticus]